MVAKIVLDEITSSGSGITIDSSKTFTVNGNLLTTGATQVTDTSLTTVTIDNTGSPTIDISGKSASIVTVDASSNSSTVTLPPVANFTTTSISVVSRVTHGAGNTIRINDNGGTEIYTLYNKGDHCEFVSDGSNTTRTGNEFATIRSQIALTSDVAIASGVVIDVLNNATASNYTVVDNIGSGWNSTTHDFIAPYAGLYRFGGHGSASSSAYVIMWLLKKNSAWVTNVTTSFNTANYNMNNVEFPMSLAKDDSIEFWASNHSGSHAIAGNGTATNPRATAHAWMLRRY